MAAVPCHCYCHTMRNEHSCLLPTSPWTHESSIVAVAVVVVAVVAAVAVVAVVAAVVAAAAAVVVVVN